MALLQVELCRHVKNLVRLDKNRMNKKQKKLKLPKISDQDAAELAEACRSAFGNDAADEFFDEVMAGARTERKLRLELEQQTRTE